MELKNRKIPKKGEIWLVDYNYKPKKGKEREIESYIKKVRPSLVISNNAQNEFDEEIIVAPLSSQELESIEPYEVFIKKSKENGLEKDSKVLLNRLRAIEKETRLGDYRIGKVEKEIMEKVREGLKVVLDLD